MHTKGPWKIITNPVEYSEYDLHTIWTDDMSVLIARTCFAPASKANARLIVKAPVLLKRLEEAREAIASLDDHALGMTFDPRAGYQWAIKAELLSNIDEAINEARGE